MQRLAVFLLCIAACTPPKSSAPATTAPKSWLVGENGLMLSSNGAGETRAHPHVTEVALNALTCVDPYTAWAVGDAGEIFFTTDSGTHWLHQTSGTTAALTGVSFSTAQHGVAAGEAGTLLETDDGGAHWQRVGVEPASIEARAYRAIALSTASGDGVAVGDGGLVSWTTDGGRTWLAHASAGTAALTGVAINEDDVAVTVGRGGVAFRLERDDVQPLAWPQISSRDLAAVRFLPDGDRVVAVGAQGTIVQAQLSSGTLAVQANPATDDLYAVAIFRHDQGEDASIMAAGANGSVVYSSGVGFEVMPVHTTATIRGLDALAGD